MNTQPPQAQHAPPSEVFLVHGRDTHAKEASARFLHRLLGREPIILHEQPDRGSTLIEKFETHATRATAAVVLITGDDQGCLIGTTRLEKRARQNVVLEMGYFVGSLGRDRVVILYEDGVEMPGDLFGVFYIPLDPGGLWKNRVARELHAMGISPRIDALLG